MKKAWLLMAQMASEGMTLVESSWPSTVMKEDTSSASSHTSTTFTPTVWGRRWYTV